MIVLQILAIMAFVVYGVLVILATIMLWNGPR